MKLCRYYIIFVLIIIVSSACEKINYFDDREDISCSTRILLHKGKGFHPDFFENTLEGAKYGLAHFDGIEVDIAVSKEGTIWLSHNNRVKDEYGNEKDYFFETSDKTITSIQNENTGFHYSRLEDILLYMSENTPGKYISIDTKRPHLLFTRDEYRAISDAIKGFVEKYDNLKGYILVEADCCYFLNWLTGADGIETYYSTLGDFDKGMSMAYQNGYSGIVFQYGREDDLSPEVIDLTHKKGLRMQIYCINEPSVIGKVIPYNVDFIQTDNIDFYDFLK